MLVALKQLTTLDFLSGGRVVTAVTAGWLEGEFASFGASYEHRGRLLDEWLSVAVSRSLAPEWIAARLSEYVDAGCNGFVVNLDHDNPGLADRVQHFAAEIAPLLLSDHGRDLADTSSEPPDHEC